MAAALAGIFLCQLLGEGVSRFFGLPLPGPVIGMGLMFLFLLVRGGQGGDKIPKNLAAVSDFLLGHLSLLFVPAAVGLMRYFDLLGANAFLLAAALVVSTAVAMAVTALSFSWLAGKPPGGGQP